MILKGFISSVALQIMLLSLCATTSSAPAHHLTIGVQGNTPTLFVTSAEIGAPSETERSRLKIQKVLKEYKANEKSKYQKTKVTAHSKKLKPRYFTKNAAVTTLPHQPSATTLGALTVNKTLIDVPEGIQVADTTLKSTQTSSDTPSPSTFVNENFTPTTEITANEDHDDVLAIGGTTTDEDFSLLGTVTPILEAHAAQTTNTIAITTTTKSPHTGVSLNSKIDDITSLAAAAAITDEMIYVTANPAESRRAGAIESLATATTAGLHLWSTNEDATQYSATTDASVSSVPHDQSEVTALQESSQATYPASQVPMLKLLAIESTLVSSTTESILKLIDLEKHSSKPFDSFGQQDVMHDNGHDGLKSIKKKQLLDRHFLEVASNMKTADIQREDNAAIDLTRHGFLGPILMEEKTFHVIHNSNHELHKTNHKLQEEFQERHSNFVEIKPTLKEDDQRLDSVTTTMLATETSQTIGLADTKQHTDDDAEDAAVLSSTTFEVAENVPSKTPAKSTTGIGRAEPLIEDSRESESKISDIQIEVYDSTIDSIVASTNFKDSPQGKTTKPPGSSAQQERFTQYVIDRTETSTQESINFSTIQVASGMPEPAAIEIHINVSESFSNDAEDLDVSFPQTDYSNSGHADDVYDEMKEKDDIKLKAPSNPANVPNRDRSNEILVVEIVDSGINETDLTTKSISSANALSTQAKKSHSTPPPPPPPPPYQGNFDRDSDTIFYISNTEVKVGESPPSANMALDERKIKLENQFFPANYMASTHPNVNTADDHHLYEEDIILSSDRNQADSLKIYRNRDEPSPPLDVTYVGESIIEVEQSPDTGMTTTIASDHVVTPQPDVIIQPAILPEISIGVPVIGELPPQIELKEIDFMPNEAQIRHSAVYGSEDTNGNVDNRLDDSSIQYGGDLIDESADGGFDGVEGSYPFGNPATMEQHKQNHVGDYAHLYINYGVNNMRKDELTADVKDSGEISVIVANTAAGIALEQNVTSKEFMNRVALTNSSNLNESERISNVTAFSIMEDPNELDEKNTEDIINLISLAIGLFIVILPVVVTCSMLWALRYLYKKYHSTSPDSNGNLDPSDAKGLASEDAAEKGESKQEPCSPAHSIKDDIQNCPENFQEPSIGNSSSFKFSAEHPTHVDSSVDLNSKIYSCSSKTRDLPLLLPLNSQAEENHTVHDQILPGPNGSITKMTLENNLLIVETEERNDISRVARETKMDYNKDGVFVVEVARGIDSRTIPESPIAEGPEKMLSMFETKHNGNMGYKMASEKVSHNNEKVQIHSPPPEKTDDAPRSLHQIEEVDEPTHSPRQCDAEEEIIQLNCKSNTGLSQSDLSSTSSNDSNKDYCYGNQELYVVEQTGYCSSSPTNINIALKCDAKDIKDDDRNSENGPYLEHSPHKDEDMRASKDVADTVYKHSDSDKSEETHKVEGAEETVKNIENATKHTDKNNYDDHVTSNVNMNDSSIHTSPEKLKVQTVSDVSNLRNLKPLSEPVGVVEDRCEDMAAHNGVTIDELQDCDVTVDITPSAELEAKHEVLEKTETVTESPEPARDQYTVSEVEERSHLIRPLDVVLEEALNHTDPSAESNGVDNSYLTNGLEKTPSDVKLSIQNGKSHLKSLDVVLEESLNQLEDSSEYNENDHVHLNGSLEVIPDDQLWPRKDIVNNKSDQQGEYAKDGTDKSIEMPQRSLHLTNGSQILPDIVPSGKGIQLIDGDTNGEISSACTTECENGYDSILSLPDPPTSDEMFCGDISEQQLDSLPPPPPPMLNETNGVTFNLKDLPPPIANFETECLPSEETTNDYASLPPPPSTTLDISAITPTTNGNLHASPLTPPASPPPHFSNGLHTAMCPPIAVDVNGS